MFYVCGFIQIWSAGMT